MFTNRRPYYGLKMSTTDFFREPVRYLKESNTQESMMEKPYLEDEYPKMHLKLPDFKFKPREIPSIFGPIANGDPIGGLAFIDYGEARCRWEITNVDYCTEGPVVITMSANYFWHAEFEFIVQIAADTIGVSLARLAETEAYAWDKQDYQLTFPDDANGSVTVCGFASTRTLISQTFETVVAGMPVGIHLIGGAMLPIERGQDKPATLLKSIYGDKGDDCGCIELSSNCVPPCECKSIGYATKGMSVDEIQTLQVISPDDGCTYDWAIDSGGGSLSSPTGTSVEYTAPSTNAECVKNPTISLSVGGNVCDTLALAVNAWMESHQAFRANVCASESYCNPHVGWGCASVVTYGYKCDGSFISQIGTCPSAGCTGDACCCVDGEDCSTIQTEYCQGQSGEMTCAAASTQAGCSYPELLGVAIDTRIPILKTYGCCPVELL